MTEIDKISKALLGWYGAGNRPGSSKAPAADTASKSSPPGKMFAPTSADSVTASSSELQNGGLNSRGAKQTLTLQNKHVRRT